MAESYVAFRAFKKHRCAECQAAISVGQDTYGHDHHVFCSRDCVADYKLLKEVM